MRIQALGIIAFWTSGCALPGFEHDPRAVPPRYDRWEAIVAAPADAVYMVALGVVVDAAYTLSAASRVDHIITTNLRQVYAGPGLNTTQHHVRFTLSVLPAGLDSSRVSISGDTCVGHDLTQCIAITAHHGGTVGSWQFVRRLGERVLERL